MFRRPMLSALFALLLTVLAAPAGAQATARTPATVEYYYRIRWGSAGEFKRLYAKNHAPILEAMRQEGFITDIRVDEPVTHLAGGQRWDLRVTLVFRDGNAAIADPAYEKAAAAARARLYPDTATFRTEEAARFALLEEHWDVVVATIKP